MIKNQRTTQILLTTKNSAWGIKINPVAMNVYQHILSFDTPELKDEFIQKILFPNETEFWKDKIRRQPHKALTIKSDLKAEIVVDEIDVGASKLEIMNKDFAIVLETDEKGKETFYYYAIQLNPIKEPHIYRFSAELDIFFTYDIKDMFKKDSEVQFVNGHMKRMKSKKEFIPFSYKDTECLPEDLEAPIKNVYNALDVPDLNKKYRYIFLSDKQDINLSNRSSYSIKIFKNQVNVWSQYFTFILDVDEKINFANNGILETLYLEHYNVQNIPQAYNGICVLPLKLENNGKINIEISRDSSKWNEKIWNYNNTYFKDFKIDIYIGNYLDKDFTNIEKSFNWKYEGKIYTSPFHSLKIFDFMYNEMDISINFLETLNPKFVLNVITSISNVKLSLTPNSGIYHQINDGEPPSFIRNSNFSPYTLSSDYNLFSPQVINNWDQFQAYNKSYYENNVKVSQRHSTQAKVKGSFGVMSGIASVGAGIATGNIGAITGGIGSIAQGSMDIANAEDEYNALIAKQEDLKNSPNQVLNSNLNYYYFDPISYVRNNFYTFYINKPNDIILEKLAQIFHIRGYSLHGKLFKINEMLKTRYYFNYIKTYSVFEIFDDKQELSSQIKQLVDATIQNGVHIWHIRDLKTFKGIRNYNVNNVEMDFLDE